MKTMRVKAILLGAAIWLTFGTAHAVDQDYDGLSSIREFELGLNDEDRDSNDDGLIDGLAFGGTALLSVNLQNPIAAPGHSKAPAITADGARVFYESNRGDLVASDRNGESDIFAVDIVTGHTQIVSTNVAGVQCDHGAWNPSTTGNGVQIVFQAVCSNLVTTPVPSPYTQVYLKDLLTGAVELISKRPDGVSGIGPSSAAMISRDGRYVVFSSFANELVPTPTGPSRSDIYLYDRMTAQMRLVSKAVNGTRANGNSYNPVFSKDGEFVAFDSLASNLVTNDTNSSRDVFVYAIATGVLQRVSVDSNGVQRSGHSTYPRLSADGRYVAFTSWAAFSPPDTNQKLDTYFYDRVTRKIELVSLDRFGRSIEQHSIGGHVSDNGRYVVIRSQVRSMTADILPPSRYPPTPSSIPTDVDFFAYVRDRLTGQVTLIAKPFNMTGRDHFIEDLDVSDEGGVAFHASGTLDAWVEGEYSTGVDIYVAKTPFADPK